MSPNTDDSDTTAARRYPSRAREKAKARTEAKYDDIFSSVFEKVTESSFRKLSNELIQATTKQDQKKKKGKKAKRTKSGYPRMKKFQCRTCRKVCLSHCDLHRHLCLQHKGKGVYKCHLCGETQEKLLEAHSCKICNGFFIALAEHMKFHYATKVGSNALYECRCCVKAFRTMEQLREHEERLHTTYQPRPYKCWSCEESFTRRYCREYHMMTHFSGCMETAFEKVDKLQLELTDGVLAYQCPLCFYALSTKKSFRLHVIHKHVLIDMETLEALCGDTSNKEELFRLKYYIAYGVPPSGDVRMDNFVFEGNYSTIGERAAALVDVKEEVLEEDGVVKGMDKYIKSEPIDEDEYRGDEAGRSCPSAVNEPPAPEEVRVKAEPLDDGYE